MSEANKASARQFIEEAFSQGKLELLDELLAPNAVFVDPSVPGGKIEGPEAMRQVITMYRNAFPDVSMTVEDQIAEGDKVVTRWSGTGTHNGDLMGIPPTGKQITVTGIDIAVFEGGKVVKGWALFDQFGMLQQLGVVPGPGGTGASS